MTRPYRHWTTGEVRRLIALRAEGRSVRECAAVLSRTFASVENAALRTGSVKTGRMEAWLAVLSRPHTLASAAREMGTGTRAVQEMKRKLLRRKFAVLEADGRRIKGGGTR